MSIVVNKDTKGPFRHKVAFPEGMTYTDVPKPAGEGDAPDPHAYFDAAPAGCKTLTITLYAHQRKYPLDSIGVTVKHDGTQKHQDRCRLRTVLTLHDNLIDRQHAGLLRVADKYPVHKLMTKVEISVDTELAKHA